MFGGSLGLQRQVQVLRSVCVNLSGAFDVGWPSGFQRPYSVERGAQRTLDYYRGVFLVLDYRGVRRADRVVVGL